MLASEILSQTSFIHVCGCPRDAARLKIPLFPFDNPPLEKTEEEFVVIAAKSGLFYEDVR